MSSYPGAANPILVGPGGPDVHTYANSSDGGGGRPHYTTANAVKAGRSITNFQTFLMYNNGELYRRLLQKKCPSFPLSSKSFFFHFYFFPPISDVEKGLVYIGQG